MPDCFSKLISRIVSIDAFPQSVVLPSYFGDHGSRAYDWAGNPVGSYDRFANQIYDSSGRVVTLSGSVNAIIIGARVIQIAFPVLKDRKPSNRRTLPIDGGKFECSPACIVEEGGLWTDRASVLVGSTSVGAFHVPLKAPAVDNLGVETPVGADSEARQLSATKQLVNR